MERNLREIPLLIVLSSPSGAGKTSIARELMAQEPHIGFSVSATTRAPRPGEIDGQHYHFLSESEFKAKIDAGEMLEHAKVFDNYYGTPKAPVENALNRGEDVIFDVDWQGGQQLRNSALRPNVVSIFILPPSIAELRLRLQDRAQDSDEVILRRMEKSRDEISHWAEYEYIVVNHDINQSVREVQAILHAERLKKDRWTGAGQYVEELYREYEELSHERRL